MQQRPQWQYQIKNIEHKNIPRHKPCLSSSVLQQRPTNTECECVRGDDNNINNNDNNINTAGNDAGLRVVPLPSAGRRPQILARKYISIFSIIFYIWHHLQPRRGDGDINFTHNRGRRVEEGSPCKAGQCCGGPVAGTLSARLSSIKLPGGEAVNTLSSLFTISHKFGLQCPGPSVR